MKNLQMFCLSLNPLHKSIIDKFGYLPVGLGSNSFSHGWLRDKTENNITFKNPYYGEYTFHYWLWKNNKINFEGWIGFCQYRKFWKKNLINYNDNTYKSLNNIILKEIPENLIEYDTIIGENFFINQFKFSKFIKHNFKAIVLDPSLLFKEKKRNIKFHFDMMHGYGNLDKAIQVLGNKDKKDFTDFVNSEVSFNPHNMFICRNKEILFSYYESLFPWLLECEKIFGFKGLEGFGMRRIYGFLAERYMSFWFKKYTKFATLPIQFKNISDFL
jgi:hypothetical protein